MLTLPVEAGSAAANRPARILVIGRSETVLSEAVTVACCGLSRDAPIDRDRAS